ncbi:calcium-binding protein [Microvirga sp. ACRRW]|uniref:calcium-binding protein n=1 Tax=Microvirga sp. ACRRW TaxID=2918205 RepID=UPI001EF40F79|nr:calcium-binding protein [Microvirga sp. ACRRW]MCG7392417.1 calcium-binding protein [Microvirga sp. ACRRW]
MTTNSGKGYLVGVSERNEIFNLSLAGLTEIYGMGGNDVIGVTVPGTSYTAFYGIVLKGGRGSDIIDYGSVGANNFATIYGDDNPDLTTASLGADRDHILALKTADNIFAGGGADYVNAAGGFDVVFGGEGDDTLFGGAGSDHIQGNVGNDFLHGATPAVVSGPFLSITVDFNGATDAALGGSQRVTGTAGPLVPDDPSSDTLDGGDGNDTLDGGLGIDHMSGGFGNDVFHVDQAGDVVVESGGGGIDKVISSVSYGLSANAEIEILQASSGALPLSLTGNAFKNTIFGADGADRLFGLNGNDVLRGESGNDVLDGGLLSDTLTGGLGRDMFVFSSKPTKTNIERITDYNVKDDTIWLENAVFKALGKKGTITSPAALKSGFFYSGSAAHDGDDHVIYNKKTGALYYDPDGIGGAAQVKIAALAKNLALTAKDFFLI